MRIVSRASFSCLAALLVAVPFARAQDAPPKPLAATATLGYVSTAGNSEVTTLNASDKVEYKSGRWLFTQDGEAIWGTDHGVENAGRYLVGGRADFSLSTRVAAYGLANWRRNVFGGVSRQFDEGVGFVYHAIVPKPQLLDFEVGAGLSQRRDTFDQEDNFSTGRLAGTYRYYFQEKAYFEGEGVYLANFKDTDDYEWGSKASLIAPLSNILALKLGYTYHFRNAPPVGVEQWDSTFGASVQATW